jgi:hypothetical protein
VSASGGSIRANAATATLQAVFEWHRAGLAEHQGGHRLKRLIEDLLTLFRFPTALQDPTRLGAGNDTALGR